MNDAWALLRDDDWAELCIVSKFDVTGDILTMPEDGVLGRELSVTAAVTVAPGTKCARCWRVLPEVGASAAHPTLCRRCDAVDTIA